MRSAELIDVEDILSDARHLVRGLFLMIDSVRGEDCDPMQTVANLVADRLSEAQSRLRAFRAEFSRQEDARHKAVA